MNEHESARTGRAIPGVSHYNPVTVDMKEVMGTAFLGILSVILLLALLLLQRQNRRLMTQLAEAEQRPS
ncbi:MAG: hypothetical protein KC441_07150 [Anaerolineales bacterium]|nr:hypothetical protein [Anaerolineales bacterium]